MLLTRRGFKSLSATIPENTYVGWHELNRASKDKNRICTDDDTTSWSYGEVRKHTSGYWFRSSLFCRSSFHLLCFHLPSSKTYFLCYCFAAVSNQHVGKESV